MSWIQKVFTPRTTDENLRRQGVLVIIVSLAVALLALVLGLNTLRFPDLIGTAAITLAGAVIGGASALLARYGIVRPAAYLITWTAWLSVVIAVLGNPTPTGVTFLSIPILLAGLVLSSWQVLPVTLLGLAAALYSTGRIAMIGERTLVTASLFVLMIGALAYLGAWSIDRALRGAREARGALEAANASLNEANSGLEARVAERTAALQQREGELERALAELHQSLADLRSSQETIRELSAPILPVGPGILVAPLIGALDSRRAALLMASLLDAAERERARYLIVDVTGILVIDTQVARALLQVAQAVRLLGAQVILTGIRPEVAQTLVGLGVNLSEMITRATLQSGLAEALGHQAPALAAGR